MIFVSIFFLFLTFADGLGEDGPVKIFVIDSGFTPGQGVPTDAVVLHDITGEGEVQNLDSGEISHGTLMTKVYYDKLSNEIDNGEVELHVMKARTGDVDGFTNESLSFAIALAQEQGADVINLSLGSTTMDSSSSGVSSLDASLNNAANNGIIIVAAAANEGNNIEGNNYINYIAKHDGTIAVGALDSLDDNNSIVNYSSGRNTGIVDVYATEVTVDRDENGNITSRGGTSSATAYVGATIVENYLDGNITSEYDVDNDGVIDSDESLLFLNSPDRSNDSAVVGTHEASYKALIAAGYEYDSEKGEFYTVDDYGERVNYIYPGDINITDDGSVIQDRMGVYSNDYASWMTADTLSLHADIGISSFEYDPYSDRSDDNASADYSKKLYNRALNLSSNGFVYDGETGTYRGKILMLSTDNVKEFSSEQLTAIMRADELMRQGYTLDPNKKGVVDSDGNLYTFSDILNNKKYAQLLVDAGVTDEDGIFFDLQDSFGDVSALSVSNTVASQDFDGVELSNDNIINSIQIDNDSQANSNDGQDAVNGNSGDVQNSSGNSVSGNTTTGSVSSTSASGSTVAEGLVPCGGTGQDACTICHLAGGAHNIIHALIEWMLALSLLVIMVAGVMYITSAGNQSTTTMAKTAIKNTLIGVSIILLAYLTVTTVINSVFLNDQTTIKTGPLSIADNAWNFNATCESSVSSTTSP